MMKRAYDKASNEDGLRILVDRLWPRGISKEELKIDHDANKFEAFKASYKKELASEEEAFDKLKSIVIEEKKQVTLIYTAKDEKYNQASVLKEILDHQQI